MAEVVCPEASGGDGRHPVRDRGDPELAELAACLGDHHLPHLDRPELARFQQVPKVIQERLDPDLGFDSGHRGPVDPRCPCPDVRSDAFPRIPEKRRVIDEVEQVTEAAGSIVSRPPVQLDLHPPYRKVRLVRTQPLHSAVNQ